MGVSTMRCTEKTCVFYKKKYGCLLCHYMDKDKAIDEVERIKEDVICTYQEKKKFDILTLDDESDWCDEWGHKKISQRLHNHGINHFLVDMWGCDEIAYILGINTDRRTVAEVLGLHIGCVYYDPEHSLMILNLFQEKILREKYNSP